MNTVRTANPREDLPALFSGDRPLSIAVAYINREGFDTIRAELVEALSQGLDVRVLLDLESGFTDPAVVWDLTTLAEEHGTLEVRTLVGDEGRGGLHAKLYIAHGDERITLVTGSANLTGAALYRNREHGIWLDGASGDASARSALSEFTEFWDDRQARSVNKDAARLYEAFAGRMRRSQSRAERRAQSAWNALTEHLQAPEQQAFVWPSVDAAYLLGVIAARGELLPGDNRIQVRLRFRPSGYTDRMITVSDTSFPADTYLPTIPRDIAARIRTILPDAVVATEGNLIDIDLSRCPEVMATIAGAYAPHLTIADFRLPSDLLESAHQEVVVEFIRGFACACALLTNATSMPGTGGKRGQMMVWLRPAPGNERLFNLLDTLIQTRLGMSVVRHWRTEKEPHIKISCENFLDIGFGIDWWDELVAAGADYNDGLFPQRGFGSLLRP